MLNTITEAAQALRAGSVSSVELTREALASIERHEPKLNAYLKVLGESAIEAAAHADNELAQGRDRGPLHGIPIALKDVFSTKGIETCCASKVFGGHIPAADSAVTEKLRDAGAVLVGKTNMHELAYGITSANPHFGPVRNPWDLERVPGGSSGGSGATVAAGSVFMAMGSDTGGSIRIPASFCGIAGIKPTSGRVSRFGVMPLDFSLDHMGPLTRTVRDAALCLQALAGYDSRDDTSSPEPVPEFTPPAGLDLRGVRLGVPENFYNEGVDAEVAAAYERSVATAAALGAELRPVRIPDMDAQNTVARVILLVEASATMSPYLARRDQFGADVLALFDQGRLISGADYVNAQRLRRGMRKEFGAVLRQVDCVLTPSTSIPAPRIGQTTVDIGGKTEDTRIAATRFSRAINLLGLPAISLPNGFTQSGLPIGLQIIGRAFEEPLVFRVAAAIEDQGDYWKRRPAL